MHPMKVTIDQDLSAHIRAIADNNGISATKYVNSLLEGALEQEFAKARGEEPAAQPGNEPQLLTVGTLVQTVGGAAQGDWDEDCDAADDEPVRRETKPGDVGYISDVYENYCTVVFPESGVCVNPEKDELLDTNQYRLFPGGNQQVMPWARLYGFDWRIVGMNHYRLNGEAHLFCAMTRNDRCIVAEGKNEAEVFLKLERKAGLRPE